MSKKALYAAYRGDDLVGIGTARELAEKMGITWSTFHYYASPSHLKRTAGSKRAARVVRIDGDDQ